MLLLGTKNIASQALAVDSPINFGNVYRRFDKRGSCGLRAFELNGTSINLQHQGMYHITAVITFTAPAAGDVSYQLFENGIAVPGAIVTSTVTTATTEINTVTLDYYILVDKDFVLNTSSAS